MHALVRRRNPVGELASRGEFPYAEIRPGRAQGAPLHRDISYLKWFFDFSGAGYKNDGSPTDFFVVGAAR
jgi:hypothetical protein